MVGSVAEQLHAFGDELFGRVETVEGEVRVVYQLVKEMIYKLVKLMRKNMILFSYERVYV